MSQIKFVCHDTPNERTVKFETTLEGEHIDHYVNAFRLFLLTLEFNSETIDRALGENDAS